MITTIEIGGIVYIVKPPKHQYGDLQHIRAIARLYGPRGAMGVVTQSIRTGWLNCTGISTIERMPIGHANDALQPLITDQEG